MRISSFILTACVLLAPPALAQDAPTPTPAPAPGGGAPPAPTPPPPPPGGERGEDGERRERRGGRGGMGLPVDRLKEDLGLTDEQAKQIEAINAEMREKAREAMRGGNFEAMRGMMEETYGKVEALLTPEQKAKFGEFRTRMQERMQRGGGFGGRGEGGPGGRGGRGGPQMRERLREDALKSLALSQEEAAVVTPLLDTVLETRELLMREEGERRNQFMEKVRGTTDQAALAKLLEEYRAKREADKATGKKAMDQLREVLTVEQEAKLVGLGILD